MISGSSNNLGEAAANQIGKLGCATEEVRHIIETHLYSCVFLIQDRLCLPHGLTWEPFVRATVQVSVQLLDNNPLSDHYYFLQVLA
jgi:hypothetical protein